MKNIVLFLNLICLLYSCSNKHEKTPKLSENEITIQVSKLLDKDYSLLTAEERSLRSSIIRSNFPDVVKSIRKYVKVGLVETYGMKSGTIIFEKIENMLKNKKLSSEAIHTKLSGLGEKQMGMEVSLEQIQLWRDYLNNLPEKKIPLKLETIKAIIDQKLFTPVQVKPNEK